METTRAVVAEAVNSAIKEAAADPGNALTRKDIGSVAQAVTKELAPAVEHMTNTEPWYQSRVTLGAIVSILIPILGAIGVSTDIIDSDQLVALLMAAGTVVGGLVTLYGRWVARKPLGS